MELQIIDQLDTLKTFEADWNRLLNESGNDNPFMQFEWIIKWWQFFGAEFKMNIVMIYDHTDIIGICPLMIGQKGFFQLIQFIGFPLANYMDLLIANDSHRVAGVTQFMHYLQTAASWKMVDLRGFIEESPNYLLVCQYLQQNNISFFITQKPAYAIQLSGNNFDNYLKARSSKYNSIRSMKSGEKRLKLLGKLSCSDLSLADLDMIFGLHDKRWERKLDTSGFSDPKNRRFFKELAAVTNPHLKTQVTALHLNKRLLAYEYGFECNGRKLLYQIAHDDDFNLFGPGKLIIKEKIHSGFSDGTQILDFSIGYERYKTEWSDSKFNVNRVIFPMKGLIAKFSYFKYYLKEKAIAYIKRYPRLVSFKRNTLGQVRFFLSPHFLVDLVHSVKKVICKYGWFGLLGKIGRFLSGLVYERQEWIIYEQKVGAWYSGQPSNFIIREATIDDIEELSQFGSDPGKIIRRFYKNDKCLVLVVNEQIRHSWWLTFTNLEIPQVHFTSTLQARGVCLYEGIEDLNQGDLGEQWLGRLLDYLMDFLKNQNYLAIFIGVSHRNIQLQNILKQVGFLPGQQITRVTRLGRSLFHTREMTGDKEKRIVNPATQYGQ